MTMLIRGIGLKKAYTNFCFYATRYASNVSSSGKYPPMQVIKSASPIHFRNQLKQCKRIVVKLGSAVITRDDECGVALGRLASIVEQVSELQNAGKQMMIVTSGAVAFGKLKLRSELSMQQTMRDSLRLNGRRGGLLDSRACAAVGQSGLVSLYEEMFNQYGVTVAQVLVTKPDFQNDRNRENLQTTIEELIHMHCIPIVNANDVVAPQPSPDVDLSGLTSRERTIISLKDNDSLAAMFAVQMNADLLIILSDVDGIYTGPPGEEGSSLLSVYRPSDKNLVRYSQVKSRVGTGGMESKVEAASFALDRGVSVVIANGVFKDTTIITDILDGKKIGTFFTDAENEGPTSEEQALKARNCSRALQNLTPHQRAEIIFRLSELLIERQTEILDVNQIDLNAAKKADNLSASMISRLALTPSKLKVLSEGLRQIANNSYDLLGRTLKATQVAEDLELRQITVPIGVVMVIFESRPDALPQVAALSIASGNGLLLKGGKEASHTNKYLHSLVQEALQVHKTNGYVDAVALIDGRDEVADLLRMKDVVDLVIPRGSSNMIASIKEMSKDIPVLGHAEGICHVYVDKEADIDMALKIVIDSKCDYPAACNAMETLLVHENLLRTKAFDVLLDGLKNNGVTVHAGPRLCRALPFGPVPAKSLNVEYNQLECAMELVDGVDDAVRHIHEYGSSHTDAIVTENKESAERFLKNVDSACVFHNTSTRFADGYRFGLGAEVGISTGRIHARGPVGVEGLLTTKWVLRGKGHVVSDFSDGGKRKYLHQPKDVERDV
ncbi:delta-1-pyrroline-5-carboxylate synthase isoform X3 [Hydra vulgaris]|uniref:Delta-1-pyrroline-5-carboxylate synthase n=1 Tax=Hydra vulgaris TaxID=6087 RepID=A0ABM4BK74_HYDVU